MTSDNMDFLPLIDDFIRGRLDPDRANLLMEQLKKDPAMVELLRNNMELDFLLMKHFQSCVDELRGVSHLPHALVINEKTDLSKEISFHLTGAKNRRNQPSDPELSWEELVRIQNAEQPITTYVEENNTGKAGRKFAYLLYKDMIKLTKKCFWPSRHDLEESIAPVITVLSLFCITVTAILFLVCRSFCGNEGESIPTMARVNDTLNAVWQEGTETYQRGQLVNSSTFQLKSGSVQLEMNTGTTIILEGPAEFTVNNAGKSFCSSGKVSVYVPKRGHGYELATPFGSVIDRGTEFFVDVTKEKFHIHTIKGRVDYMFSLADIMPLKTGESIIFDQTKKVHKFSNPVVNDYISTQVFTEKVKARTVLLQEEKTKINQKLDENPNLLVHLDLTNQQRGTVTNRAHAGRQLCEDASVVGCSLVEGTMYQKKVPAMKTDSAKINSTLPGAYRSMAFVIDVRIDQLTNMANTLLISDSFQATQGSIRWQITKTGRLQFFIFNHEKNGRAKTESYTSEEVLKQIRPCTWVRLAVVLDAEHKTITHYVDGQKIIVLPWKEPIPIVPGKMTIGNILKGKISENSCYLDGAVERLLIYDNATITNNPILL